MSKRARRIKDHVSIERLLSDYGYNVREINREQQFQCDLHGDGTDNAPSARSYPQSNSWYCFACGKTRDAISTVREREGVDFSQACSMIERKYGLPVWDNYKPADPFEEVEDSEPTDLETLRDKTIRRLERLISERVIELPNALRLWEAVSLLSQSDKQSKAQWEKVYDKLT